MNQYYSSSIEGVRRISGYKFTDLRGEFYKFNSYKILNERPEFFAFSLNPLAGTIRGLHFQISPVEEEKLVTCIQGRIFDVVVDLRPTSTTYGKWSSFVLDKDNCAQLYIPKGIAHGFQTLLDDSIILYSLTSTYSPQHSFSINPLNEYGAIWPMVPTVVSERDSKGLSLIDAKNIYKESLDYV